MSISRRAKLGLTLCLAAACTAEAGADGGESSGDDGSSGSSAEAGETGDSTVQGVPCDVAAVLEARCLDCHQNPPIYGAPMSLVDWTDVHAGAPSDENVPVFQRIAERIEDTVRPMPPTGDLSDEDKATLHAWIDAGAPAYEGTCEGTDTGDTPVGPDALPCEPSHTFVAHSAGSEDPFQVPEVGADNLYECFTFKSPFTTTRYATAWAPITDDERVLHHWILYRTTTPQEDGGAGPCNMPQDAIFVSGWAPGGENFVMPDNVGLELGGPDDYFILQVHYHNTMGFADAFDKSGVAMCTTEEPREHTAGVLTLGTININIPPGMTGYTAVGECPSSLTQYVPAPVYALASFPHMHQLGRKFRTDILRGGSVDALEPLVDVPIFNFENQVNYPHDPHVEIRPGDALRTQCTYDNPYNYNVFFGEKTENEMCFNFVMVYPIELVGQYRQCGIL